MSRLTCLLSPVAYVLDPDTAGDANPLRTFDPSEKAVVGKRSREWTTAGPTEVEMRQEHGLLSPRTKAGRKPYQRRGTSDTWQPGGVDSLVQFDGYIFEGDLWDAPEPWVP